MIFIDPPQIRAAQPNDIPLMFHLIEQVTDFHKSLDTERYNFLPNQGQLYENWLRRLIKDSRHLCLVAETKSDSNVLLVGYMVSTLETEIPIYHLKEYGYIQDLWVEEPYRHQGIARQMVKQTIDHFRQLGVKQLRLNTLVANDAAFKLYSACGFRTSTFEMLLTCE
ncbi:acetyltransferase [Synechococcus sp. PCC 7502]|nr:acetyltransferase [Synechococcus sp. PCC 7502]